MTPQHKADAYLAAWGLLRAAGVPPELRLPLIDVYCEFERARRATQDQDQLQARPQADSQE